MIEIIGAFAIFCIGVAAGESWLEHRNRQRIQRYLDRVINGGL
jgi:hypothetical protein